MHALYAFSHPNNSSCVPADSHTPLGGILMDHILSKTGTIIRYTLGVTIVLLGFITHWTLTILPSMQY